MNCTRCNTENNEGAQFCKNCGTSLNTSRYDILDGPEKREDHSQTINYLLNIFIIEISLLGFWFIVQKGFVPLFFKRGGQVNWSIVSPIYTYLGYATDLAMIGILVMYYTMLKHERAKYIIMVYAIVKVVLLLGYRVFDGIID